MESYANMQEIYCSGESGGDWGERKGQGDVRLAIRNFISRAEARSPELISSRLQKVTLELCGRGRAVTFVVGYSQANTQAVEKQYAFGTSLGRVVNGVPVYEHNFV